MAAHLATTASTFHGLSSKRNRVLPLLWAGGSLGGFPALCCAPEPQRATLCYMKEITHRQMRNDSGEVLRRVGAGETILVTNSGQPAAVIGPPPEDVFSLLSAQGQVRKALKPPTTLLAITRRRTTRTTAEIIAEVRGHG